MNAEENDQTVKSDLDKSKRISGTYGLTDLEIKEKVDLLIAENTARQIKEKVEEPSKEVSQSKFQKIGTTFVRSIVIGVVMLIVGWWVSCQYYDRNNGHDDGDDGDDGNDNDNDNDNAISDDERTRKKEEDSDKELRPLPNEDGSRKRVECSTAAEAFLNTGICNYDTVDLLKKGLVLGVISTFMTGIKITNTYSYDFVVDVLALGVASTCMATDTYSLYGYDGDGGGGTLIEGGFGNMEDVYYLNYTVEETSHSLFHFDQKVSSKVISGDSDDAQKYYKSFNNSEDEYVVLESLLFENDNSTQKHFEVQVEQDEQEIIMGRVISEEDNKTKPTAPN